MPWRPTYEGIDFAIPPDVPPHPGTGLYPLSKSLGHEVCRILAETHDIYVQEYLFYSLRETGELAAGAGGVPFELPVVQTNSIGMKLVLIPPGEFEAAEWDRQGPRVKITEPFYRHPARSE